MNIDNIIDNGNEFKGFDTYMDNREPTLDNIAYEVYTMLTEYTYSECRDYMILQGYNIQCVHKIWHIIREQYL